MLILAAFGVTLFTLVAMVTLPSIRRFRLSRPHRMMPRWPEDWPPRSEYLMRSLPPRPPQRWSWREWLGGVYWGSQRLHWRAEGGYVATVSGRRMIGSGAVRLGRLVPTNWIERRFPLEVWVPRSLMYRHLGIAGPTGAGKTATFGVSVPYYAAFSGQSVFLNDVKNPPEYFAWFVDHFRRHGRHAINFNPWTPHETLATEPVHAATREELDIIIDTLVTASAGAKRPGSASGNEFFFESAARQLLTSLVIALRYLPRRYCTLPTLYQIVAMGAKSVTGLFSGIEAQYPTLEAVEEAARTLAAVPGTAGVFEPTWGIGTNVAQPRTPKMQRALEIIDRCGHDIQTWLRETRVATWVTRTLPPDVDDPTWDVSIAALRRLYKVRRQEWERAVAELGTLIEQPDQTFSNLVLTAQNYLQFFKTPELARAFSRPEFDIRDVVRRPTLCVIGSPQAKADVGGRFVGRLFTRLALNLVYERGKVKGFDPAHAIDVLFLLDEMPEVVDESLPRVLATVRSYKGAAIGMYQSDAQLRTTFGDAVGTVLDNFVNQVTLAGVAGDTARRTAERVGKATVMKQSRSRNSGDGQKTAHGVSESAERVERMTEADVTDMRLNGRVMGERAAISTGKVTAPFLFTLVPFWDDPYLVRGLGVTRRPDGRYVLPENRMPFRRAPLTHLLNPERPPEAWAIAHDEHGVPIPDAHAVDPLRDTVDYLDPPTRTTYYEWADLEFRPPDLGLTPVTAATLRETLDRKQAAVTGTGTQAPTSPVPAATQATTVRLSDTVLPSPGHRLSWIEAMVAHEDGVPRHVPVPVASFEDRAYGWRETWDMWTAALRQGRLGVPAPCGAADWVERLPLEWYLVHGFHVAIDYPSWIFQWLMTPGVAPPTPTGVRVLLGQVVTRLDHWWGGVPAPMPIFRAWAACEDTLPPRTRTQTATFIEAVRDRYAAVRDGEILAAVWAECRTALLDLVPETVTAAAAWRFCVGELLIDYGAYARAMHLDLMRLADPAAVNDAAFVRAFEHAEYEMQARGIVLREMRQGTRVATALANHPGRIDLVVRLASARRAAGVEHQVAASLGIDTPMSNSR